MFRKKKQTMNYKFKTKPYGHQLDALDAYRCIIHSEGKRHEFEGQSMSCGVP